MKNVRRKKKNVIKNLNEEHKKKHVEIDTANAEKNDRITMSKKLRVVSG